MCNKAEMKHAIRQKWEEIMKKTVEKPKDHLKIRTRWKMAAECIILSGLLLACGSVPPKSGNISADNQSDISSENPSSDNNTPAKDALTTENPSKDTPSTNTPDGNTQSAGTSSENASDISDGKDAKDSIPAQSDSMPIKGMENLEKYINIEDIKEPGLRYLRLMQSWCDMPHDGTFVLNGWNEEEQAVAERLCSAAGKTVCWIVSEDFNQDGRREAFAYVCDLKAPDGIEIWFAADDGTVQQLEESNDFYYPSCIRLPGNTFLQCDLLGADNVSSYLYEVEKNQAKPSDLDCFAGVEQLENGRVCVTCKDYDLWSESGHYGEKTADASSNPTFKYYYYYYDKNNFHEYSGAAVTEEEFCQYENGLEILNTIRTDGGIVKDIYYFADGRMIVNCMEDKVEYYGKSEKTPYKNNYYLQIPILSEGEDGFRLAWDDSLNIEELRNKTDSGEYGIFAGYGIYRPVFMEQFAEYPDYQSPFNYYKEKYSNLKKSDLAIYEIDSALSENPKRIEILATGEDMEGISRHNLIFSFTEQYLAASRAKIKNEENQMNIEIGALLGLPEGKTAIGIWIGDEYICSGSLQPYISYDAIGFVGTAYAYMEYSTYYNRLTFMDNEDARFTKKFTAAAAVKIHAFAEAAGLNQPEESMEIVSPGTYRTEQEYLVDLNGDGKKESLFYGQGSLLIDHKDYRAVMSYRDNPDIDFFFLWDIDPEDGILEIGIWMHGPSSDECTFLYWYDGETLRLAGCIEGPWQKQYDSDIFFDGEGGLQTTCRLSILQTWWAPMSFCLDEEHQLVQVPQKLYYPIPIHEEVHAYTLLQPVRLYKTMDASSDFELIQAGEQLALLATDNENFVLIETGSGIEGYLYLKDGFKIENPEGGYYETWASEIIEGLIFAD